jgi:integrase
MATIRERVDSDGQKHFHVQIRLRGYPPQTKSFTRKTDAKQWAVDTEAAIRKGDILSTEADRTTLGEALGRYLREVSPKKKDAKREASRIKVWQKHPLAVRYLSKLRGSDFAEYRDARLKDGKANNTVSLELKLISAVYKTASREWKMEGLRNPIKNVTMPGGSNSRNRRLSADEQTRLMVELKKTPYMAEIAELAIESAMRQGELLSLTWADIDKEKRIAHLRDTKNSEPRDVPLSTKALAIIEALPRAIKADSPLFPMSQDFVIRTFRAACTDAEIADLKFHDLRHEATSRICDRLPMHEAMRITGHKTPSMLMRYYHPKAEDLARKLG